MGYFSFDTLINSLDDYYFSLAKRLFVTDINLQANITGYKLGKFLLNLISKDKFMYLLDREEFSSLLNSLFSKELSEVDKSLVDYINLLNAEISVEAGVYRTVGRAQNYTAHLMKNYVDKVNQKDYSLSSMGDTEVLNFLIDFVNIILAIYKQHRISPSIKDPVSNIDFKLEYKFAQMLTNGLFDKKSLFEELGERKKVNFFQSIIEDADAPVRNSQRMFFYCLTWMIYVRICQDNGYNMWEGKT